VRKASWSGQRRITQVTHWAFQTYFLFLHTTLLCYILPYVLRVLLRSLFFSILLPVLQLICLSSFFFTRRTSCASRDTFLPSSSECSSGATIISLHFLCHKESVFSVTKHIRDRLTLYMSLAARCINGNLYLNIAQ